MLFFAMVIMPLMLVGLSLSADINRVVYAHRTASDTAYAVALAAANQYTDGEAAIDTSAQVAAETLFKEAVAPGADGSPPMMAGVDSATLSRVEISADKKSVTVQIDYQMSGFVFLDAFSSLLGGDQTGTREYSVVSVARICNPGDGDNCAYPLQR